MKFIDSKLYAILEKAFDVLFVNLLFIITSLPVITLIPSILSAIYALTSNPLEGESLVKKYFKKYIYFTKKMLILSTLASMMLVVDVLFYRYALVSGNMIFLVLANIILFELLLIVVGFMVGYYSHETSTFQKRYINAIIVGHRNLVSVLISILITFITLLISYYFVPFIFVAFGISIFIINKLNIQWSDLDDKHYLQ